MKKKNTKKNYVKGKYSNGKDIIEVFLCFSLIERSKKQKQTNIATAIKN